MYQHLSVFISFQGAQFQQVYYDGAVLQTTPWHQHQGQQAPPWAVHAPPPPQVVPQFTQQYPQLGNIEPITNYYEIGAVLVCLHVSE